MPKSKTSKGDRTLKWGLYLHGMYIQPTARFPTKRAAEAQQAKEHEKGNQAVVMRI
jgi:hypothetical protein